MLKSILTTLAAASLLTTVSIGTAQAGGDCQIAKDPKTEVGKACQEGGIKRAKAIMKAITKKAKTAGMKVDCDSCHKSEETWELTDDGEKKFKELMEKIKG